MADKGYDFLFKVPIVGDSGVGKTALLLRFVEDKFDESPTATLDEDYKMKQIAVDNQRVKLQIWDTAGQERFRTVTSSFYRAAKGTILVFDVTNPATFSQAQQWVTDIRNNTSQTAPLFLVGNKTDLPDRKVTADSAKEFAKTHRLEYYETSAKSSQGVTEAFTALCRAMIGGGDKGGEKPAAKKEKKKGGCTLL